MPDLTEILETLESYRMAIIEHEHAKVTGIGVSDWATMEDLTRSTLVHMIEHELKECHETTTAGKSSTKYNRGS